jgi:hypothetical protein
MVHELLAEGHGIRAIARQLGWGRHTVQRCARAATWQELVDGRWQAPRASMPDPFKPRLHQRAGQGCGNAAQRQLCQGRPVTVEVQDARELELDAGAFDIVHCSWVLHLRWEAPGERTECTDLADSLGPSSAVAVT